MTTEGKKFDSEKQCEGARSKREEKGRKKDIDKQRGEREIGTRKRERDRERESEKQNERERETERETDIQRQTDRQAGRWI